VVADHAPHQAPDQYDVWLVNLDPTVGSEIQKTRPCLVISPDELNHVIATVVIAPMTTMSRDYPTRVPTTFRGKSGWIVLDQIRTVDRSRLIKHVGRISATAIKNVKLKMREIYVD
jgi:mRNA interferase MazF